MDGLKVLIPFTKGMLTLGEDQVIVVPCSMGGFEKIQAMQKSEPDNVFKELWIQGVKSWQDKDGMKKPIPKDYNDPIWSDLYLPHVLRVAAAVMEMTAPGQSEKVEELRPFLVFPKDMETSQKSCTETPSPSEGK